MKQRYRLIKYGSFCIFMLTPLAAAAGLDISDVPLYVTQPVAPNIILSPVYNTEFNEVSMRKVPPWSLLSTACSDEDPERPCKEYVNAQEQSKSYWQYGAPFYWYSPVYGYRVVPWPDVEKLASSPKQVYSKVALYPNDNVLGRSNETQFKPLDYVPSKVFNSYIQFQTSELYPESDLLREKYKGRALYMRSDLNFLYFNKEVADNVAHGYLPWPSLGDYTFKAYSEDGAATPRYHPLNALESKVVLNKVVNYWTRYRKYWPNETDYVLADDGYVVDQDKGLVGQYSKFSGGKGGDANVWNASSYSTVEWDDMSPDDNIKFAHWFTYWRSSDLAGRGMLGRVIDRLSSRNLDLLKKIRLGIFHGKKADDGTVTKSVRVEKRDKESDLIKVFAEIAYDQNNVYTMRNSDFTTADYVRSFTRTTWDPQMTTDYFSSEDPYLDYPGVAKSTVNPVRSCRRNYEVVLTPDYTGLRRDGASSIQRPSTIYAKNADADLGSPYSDGYPQTFGDVGAHGWNTDLMDKLDDNLLGTKNDDKTSQHLVRYVIGPSGDGIIFDTQMSSYDAALEHLKSHPASGWYNPYPLSGDKGADQVWLTVIDELWHMALNSRGYFYMGDNIGDSVDNLLQSINDILVASVSGSSIATSTTSLSTDDLIYQASVESDWKGHLRAFIVEEDVNDDSKKVLNIDFKKPKWDLAEKVTGLAWSDRNIATYNGATGVAFRWGNINDELKGLLKEGAVGDSAAYGEKVLEYLRGSGDCEDGSLTSCASGEGDDRDVYSFRRRNIARNNYKSYSTSNPNGRNVLGDIANSNPWLVAAPVAGPSDVDFPGYNKFRVANKARSSVLYVGANDGMLHAVNASDGSELFAYIPGFVQDNLYLLAKDSYGHKYYADGSPFSANVNVGDTTEKDEKGNVTTVYGWRTLLAGGANKGGKGYYLLDVTSPTTNTEANAKDWVKWEFTHTDLHYSYNLPVSDRFGQARQFVRTNDAGKWALIVGNGYPEDANKQACLFIIYVSGPTGDGKAWVEGKDYRKLCAGVTDYSATGSNDGGLGTNGLSTPTPYDTNGDGKVDVVYAGDLNGNLWRFDVGSATPGEWAVAYSGDPVFVAKNDAKVRQPIISPPEVTTLLVGSTVGQLLLFGSGKYLEDSDISDESTQSFYGVWDRGLSGITRSNLVAQVLDTPEAAGSVFVRKQTNKSYPVYCSTSVDLAACVTANKNLGWYWDMPTVGERQTGKSSLINGVVFFNTFYPETESYDVVEDGKKVTKYRLDPCEYGGDGWLMGLNAVNGYMEDRFSVFDVNQDGVVDESSDAKVAGVRVGASMGGTTFAKGLKDTMVGLYSPSNKEQTDKNNKAIIKIDPNSTGRVSWFELLD